MGVTRYKAAVEFSDDWEYHYKLKPTEKSNQEEIFEGSASFYLPV